jgi:hypothetical protein
MGAGPVQDGFDQYKKGVIKPSKWAVFIVVLEGCTRIIPLLA